MESKAICGEKVQRTNGTGNRLDNVYIYLGEHLLKFENVEIDRESAEKARKELREEPKIVKESLEAFRKLITAEPYLNYPTDDDEKLRIFLRPCKYYPSSALDKLKNFYRFKYQHPEYMDRLTPCNQKKAFHQNLFTILPYRTAAGERVVLTEVGEKWDTNICTIVDIFRTAMIMVEAALGEPKTQINGIRVIVNSYGLSLKHFWQLTQTPAFAKHVLEWVQDCMPLRLKGIHIVNQHYIFDMLLAFFKPVLKDKLIKRLHLHGTDFKDLHKHIGASVLPKEFGGDLDIPLDEGEKLHKYFTEFEAEFKEKLPYGYSKLPPKDRRTAGK